MYKMRRASDTDHHCIMFLVAAIFFLLAVGGARGLQCKDEKGEDVDWYYVYKLPKIPQHENEFVKRGVAYAYLTSAAPDTNWTLAEQGIDDPDSVLGKTLAPVYDTDAMPVEFHLMYNDRPPMRFPRWESGHTKGVFMQGKESAVWLVHSVPEFPPPPFSVSPRHPKKHHEPESIPFGHYLFPHKALDDGHMAMCITLPTRKLLDLVKIFLRTEPKFYSWNKAREHLPGFVLSEEGKLKEKFGISDRPYKTQLKSLGEKTFTIYAKPENFHKDIYSGVILPDVDDDLRVSTKIRLFGEPTLPPYCDYMYQVHNVLNTKVFLSNQEYQVDISALVDESKWAVTTNRTQVACFGDLDRIKPHKHLPGAAICTADSDIWDKFSNMVDDIQQCMILPK